MARKSKRDEPPGSAESLLIDGETWETTAWRLWTVEGKRRIGALTSALQKEFPNAPKDTRTVRAGIERVSQAVATVQRQGLISANAEYICSLEAMLDKALSMHRTADNANAAVAALKAAVDLHEKIAAAKGVVTERKATELTGSGGASIQVESEVAHDVRPNGNLMQLLATMRDLAPLIPPVGGCSDAEVDEVPAAPAEPETDSVPAATAP